MLLYTEVVQNVFAVFSEPYFYAVFIGRILRAVKEGFARAERIVKICRKIRQPALTVKRGVVAVFIIHLVKAHISFY